MKRHHIYWLLLALSSLWHAQATSAKDSLLQAFSFKARAGGLPPRDTTNTSGVYGDKVHALSQIGRDHLSQMNSQKKDKSLKDMAELDPYLTVTSNNNMRLTQTRDDARFKAKSRGQSQMNHVYASLKEGNYIFNDKDINTIRHIPSSRTASSNKLTFRFNLSLLSKTEKLIKAELYLNRKLIKHRLKFNLRYFLGRTTSVSKSDSATIIDLENFRSVSGNVFKRNPWQMFNIGDSLSSYFAARNGNEKQAFNKRNKTVYFTLSQVCVYGCLKYGIRKCLDEFHD